MRVFGLTGGIGCGKTTVGRLFEHFGVPRVDADQVARDVVAPGTEGLQEIISQFGREVLDSEGFLDRKRLGSIVFHDEALRLKLNAIVHPRIAVESMQRLTRLQDTGSALALYEAALLVENNTHKNFAGLIVVTAQPEMQRMRVMKRDGLSPQEAAARIRAQFPVHRKVAAADHVIDNSGTAQQLEERVAALYAELIAN